MSSPITAQPNNRVGLCPHGLVPSACPVCSGGAAGGVNKMKDSPASKPSNSGQWSFMKCYAAGLAIKAQEARIDNRKNILEKQLEFAHKLEKNIQNLTEKIQNALQNIKSTAPIFIFNTLQTINNLIIKPVLNIIAKISGLIIKITELQQKITNLLQQAGEKLTAILGDIKNFIDKKIIEDIKKKAKKIFSFFIPDMRDENYQNDDTLAVFKARELRKYIAEILKKNWKRNNNAD